MTNTILYPSGVYLNADGLFVRYPPFSTYDSLVGVTNLLGDDQEMIIDIEASRLPTYQSAITTGMFADGIPTAGIPAGAFVRSAILTVETAFVGTSGVLIVGLVDKAGQLSGNTHNDGLINATNGAVAGLGTAGLEITGTGGDIGVGPLTVGASQTDNALYPWVTVTGGTFSAGKGRLRVTYFVPDPTKSSSVLAS